MAVHSFLTIEGTGKGVYKEKRSRFLGFAFPVTTEIEVKEHLALLRRKYFDASHQGYAYVLGPDQKVFRAFDDGEPGHSTGDPILGQIRSRKLTNVLVVVVRYFGGAKLGVPGLIHAYRTAASEALADATIVEEVVTVPLELIFAFEATPSVMRFIKDFELRVVTQEFGEAARIALEVPLRSAQTVAAKLEWLRATGSTLKWTFSAPA